MSSRIKKLNKRQQRFVEEYLKDANGARSAIAAGYPEKFAAQQAYKLLNRCPYVVQEIERVRKSSQESARYNLERAMAEAERLMNEAREARQFSAVAKFAELRMKLNGLLVEKHDVRSQTQFKILIEGIDSDERDVIEVQAAGTDLKKLPEV